MLYKFFYSLFCYFSIYSVVLAQNMPGVGGPPLPGAGAAGEGGIPGNFPNAPFLAIANNFISYFIQIVAVIAVLALMLSGIMLIISGGEEEKFKKSKTWFTWSLIGVFISLTAWFMINFLNRLNIG